MSNLNMDKYIRNKLNDYLKELQENNFKINSGRKLELITAYKNNSILYEDVPEYIKDKYGLPSRDEGIDVIKLNNEEIIETYQCKDYNGRVSNHKLGTYFGFHLYQLKNIPFNIVGSTNTLFNSAIKPIIYDVNEDFGEYVEENKNVCILDNLRWYQNECIKKIEKLYLDLITDPNIDEDSDVDSENDSMIITNEEFRVKIPCGCGKTAIMYYFGCSGYNILILVPKINIAIQIKNYFECNLNKIVNTYWTNTNKNNNSNVTICVYDSVDKVKFNRYDMIFVDEAHHIIGSKLYKYYNEVVQMKESYIDTIKKLECTLKIYLSATIDVKHIENSYELNFNQAIKKCYLTDYEFNILYVEPDFEENYHKLVKIIKENKEYKHIIIYCNRIETAERINDLLNNYKIISHVIVSRSDNTTELKREHILEDFKNGLVKVLCSVNCLNEGTDLPIADTCMFVNDRGSEINIIQCIGRVLRKYKYKSKARIVLFDTNQNDAELKYENYMKVIDKIDFGFKQDLKHKLKIYNYSNDYKFDLKIKEKENEYFDKIIRFRLTLDDKLKLCQEFYDIHHRMPITSEKYNGWNIGVFINHVRNGKYKCLNQIKHIFKEHWIDGNIKEYEYKQKLELCEQFYNKFYRLPKQSEKYNELNIGKFIYRIKINGNENKIKDLKEIFKEHWIDGNVKEHEFKHNLTLCQEFYNKYHRMPKDKERYNGFGIGSFVHDIRRGKNKGLNQIKEIFNDVWIDGNIKEYEYKQKLELCKQFYNEFHKLPKQNEIYNGWNIGKFISWIKTRNKDKINDLEEIFHCKFD
jgi:superfamily II DNA or RNA helicase/uncharacterized membrane protein